MCISIAYFSFVPIFIRVKRVHVDICLIKIHVWTFARFQKLINLHACNWMQNKNRNKWNFDTWQFLNINLHKNEDTEREIMQWKIEIN